MFELWKVNWQLRGLQRSYRKERQKLVKRKASRDEIGELEANEYFEVLEVEKAIDMIVSSGLFHEARKLDVETPPPTEETMWVHDRGQIFLSPKGRAQVRRLIDEEKERRFKIKTRWVTVLILPVLAALVGIIGAITGLVAVLHRR